MRSGASTDETVSRRRAGERGARQGSGASWWVQMAVVLVFAGAFLLYATRALPPENEFLPHRGIALILLAGGTGWACRDRGFHYAEALAAFFLAFAVMFFPVAQSRPPSRVPGFVAAGLAFETAFAVWGLLRFPVHEPRAFRPFRSRVRRAVRIGLYMASGLSLFVAFLMVLALVAVLLGAESDGFWAAIIGGAVVAYYVAALAAGSVVGAMAPISVWPLGAMATGVVGTALVYAPVEVVIMVFHPDYSFTMLEHLGMAGGLGLMIGPAMGVSFRYGRVLENWGLESHW